MPKPSATTRVFAADGTRLLILTTVSDGEMTIEVYRGHSRTNQLLTKAMPLMATTIKAATEDH